MISKGTEKEQKKEDTERCFDYNKTTVCSKAPVSVIDMVFISCLRVRAPFLVFVRAHIDNAVFV